MNNNRQMMLGWKLYADDWNDLLVESLKDFEGTMLFVSHDRTFLKGLSNRVLALRPGDGNGVPAQPPFEYGGSYVEFVERTGSEAAGVHR